MTLKEQPLIKAVSHPGALPAFLFVSGFFSGLLLTLLGTVVGTVLALFLFVGGGPVYTPDVLAGVGQGAALCTAIAFGSVVIGAARAATDGDYPKYGGMMLAAAVPAIVALIAAGLLLAPAINAWMENNPMLFY